MTAYDRNVQKTLRRQLNDLLKQEEMKWLQRYKDQEIKEGDCNTRYYHAKANGKRRKNRILSLEQEEGLIEGEENLMQYITSFYKNLFGQTDPSSITLNIQATERISPQDAIELTRPFSKEELKSVVFSMEKK